jgi:hypothetical protein
MLIVIAVVLAGGIIAVVLNMPKTTDDNGPGACAHVDQQAEMDAEKWDGYIDDLVATVQNKMVNPDEKLPIRIRSTNRGDRCRETMRKLQRAMQPESYARLVDCIADATTTRSATRCLELVR